MADFTYMGSKKLLAPQIAKLVATMPDGPFLDLFSGIAAVGSEIGAQRTIWCNDVQNFSGLLTGQRFCSAYSLKNGYALVERAKAHFAVNQAALAAAFRTALEWEEAALKANDADSACELIAMMAKMEKTVALLRGRQLHCMLTGCHGATYFGIQQAIDLDSIRYAADRLLANGEATAEEHRWMVLALCQTLATVSNSTGHFAQYLTPSDSNIRRVVRKRRMDCWALWSQAMLDNRPLGTVAWRRTNRVYQSDATELLRNLSTKIRQPAVIYADPPYTSDQYSRYYHVLENAVLYDYPEIHGKGQYRPDRFTSGFSLKGGVNLAFGELISAAAKMRSVFILSYPNNGLLKDSTNRVLELLTDNFAHVEAPIVFQHLHSTMGGSKGAQKQAVDENIFVAYQNPAARWHDQVGVEAAPAQHEHPVHVAEDFAA